MFGSEILEVAIGLVFVFLIASLIATTIREGLEAILKTRAVQLERGIRQMLDDKDGETVTKDLFDHPLLFGLFLGDYDPRTQLTDLKCSNFKIGLKNDTSKKEPADRRINLMSSLPAYIPSRNFALALLDVISSEGSKGAGVLSLESVKANAMTLPDGRLRQAILIALAEGGNDIDRVRTSLEAWFDGTMDRVSGWYKRETQWILLAVGLAVAVALNINSLEIAHDLSTSNTLRQSMIARVESNYKELNSEFSKDDLRKQVDGLSGVIGWPRFWKTVDERDQRNILKLNFKAGKDPTLATTEQRSAWVESHRPSRTRIVSGFLFAALPGWILTAIAVSLGAPFWFDILNKFMVIRSTVKPYEKSPSEGSEDRAGSKTSADRLAPGAADGAAPPPGGGGGSVGVGQAGVGPVRVNFRIAFDTASFDQNTLALTAGGKTIAVPPDGFLELPLVVGEAHALKAEGQSGGKNVAWAMNLTPSLNDEAQPVEATLTRTGQ